MDLAWSPATDADSGIGGYRIYRGSSPGSATWLADVAQGLTYTDTGTLSDTTYYYQVAAVNGAGLEGARSTETGVTTGGSSESDRPLEAG